MFVPTKTTQMTTTTTTAAASYPSSLNDGARIYELRRAMCAWRADIEATEVLGRWEKKK